MATSLNRKTAAPSPFRYDFESAMGLDLSLVKVPAHISLTRLDQAGDYAPDSGASWDKPDRSAHSAHHGSVAYPLTDRIASDVAAHGEAWARDHHMGLGLSQLEWRVMLAGSRAASLRDLDAALAEPIPVAEVTEVIEGTPEPVLPANPLQGLIDARARIREAGSEHGDTLVSPRTLDVGEARAWEAFHNTDPSTYAASAAWP